IAMTFLAPEITAPCRALMPMPPTPTITAVSPGCTRATLVAEPNPVGEVKLIPPMSATGVGAFWFNPSIAHQCLRSSEAVFELRTDGHARYVPNGVQVIPGSRFAIPKELP